MSLLPYVRKIVSFALTNNLVNKRTVDMSTISSLLEFSNLSIPLVTVQVTNNHLHQTERI